jgi:hypothetical protein
VPCLLHSQEPRDPRGSQARDRGGACALGVCVRAPVASPFVASTPSQQGCARRSTARDGAFQPAGAGRSGGGPWATSAASARSAALGRGDLTSRSSVSRVGPATWISCAQGGGMVPKQIVVYSAPG